MPIPFGKAVLQGVAGLAIVIAVYYLSLFLMHQDRIFIDDRVNADAHAESKIITGYVDSSNYQNRVFNTISPSSKNYVSLPPSFNRKGGAQLSYSFWVFIDNPAETINKTILLRGDNRSYTAAVFTGKKMDQLIAAPETAGKLVTSASDKSRVGVSFPVEPDEIYSGKPLVAAPRISFGNAYDQLVVHFNSTHTIQNLAVINPSRDADDTKRRNAMKLIAHKWALFTIVLEDNVAINDFEDGIIMRFYLNDLLYSAQTFSGSLRVNDGNLYIFPDGGIAGLRIADLTYYNYALGREKVKALYDAGPSRFYFSEVSKNTLGDPLYLSEYNKLDIYNS